MSGSNLRIVDNTDVDELVASMTSDLMYWQSLGNFDDDETKCNLIFKVPQCIRTTDPNAYEPCVLSIGPFHNGDPSLFPMEKEKWLCLDYILKLNCNRKLHDYLAMLTALEREARMCYAEDSIVNSRVFVEMLLLDTFFILVCLNGIGGTNVQEDINECHSLDHNVQIEEVVGKKEARMVHEKGKEIIVEGIPGLSHRTNEAFAVQMEQDQVDSHKHTKRSSNIHPYNGQTQEQVDQGVQWYNSSAVYDLLLLENQIPFFVVTKVYELLVHGERAPHALLSDQLCQFIEGVLLHFPIAIRDNNRPKDFDHLLHLCYIYFKPSQSCDHRIKKRMGYFQSLLFQTYKYFGSTVDSQENEDIPISRVDPNDMHYVKEFQRWRRAEQYHDAGVEFKDREFDEHNPHSLLDIEFKDGVFHIPCLPIDDKSATLLRNLVAFEQSCPALGNDIVSYVYFLSQLISVPDDVALLARKGVIVHQLESDEEVSTLFAKLFEYVFFDASSEHYLRSLYQTTEAHYQNRVNRWMSWLWHKHFGNPWLGFTALASVIMVLCSIGQTVLAFLSYIYM